MSRDFPEFTKAHCEAAYYELLAAQEGLTQLLDVEREWFSKHKRRARRSTKLLNWCIALNLLAAIWHLCLGG